MPTAIHQFVRDARAGENPRVVCRVTSGWVVLGASQFLRGYSLLLPDPVVPHMNAMSEALRKTFLHEMTLVGDALLELTDAVRMNYEMLGNLEPALHAHVFPRYDDEAESLRTKPVWFYDWDAGPRFDAKRDGELMRGMAAYLRGRGVDIDPGDPISK